MKWETVAEFAFIGGVILAFIIGAMPGTNMYAYSVVMLLGVVVGLVNMFDRNLERFMHAINTIILATILFYILASQVNDSMLIALKNIATAIAFFVGPVAFVAAVKDVYDLAMEYQRERRVPEKKRRK
ncbi:MAG: hypothetical protein N3H30_01665 [Candidatus Micrarchaeota archaeon]|nr:hypothetical protein [Candidatus Micrarchaeota archaeon]